MSNSPEDRERREAELTREVADRAIRRLNLLEHLFLMVAAGAALVAGLLVAWLLSQSLGWNFRTTWAVSALLLFILPAGVSGWRVRREERDWLQRRAARDPAAAETSNPRHGAASGRADHHGDPHGGDSLRSSDSST
ncbi:MAG: hypothetical protein RQ745_10335 [Longimicrobiales bacterium]|nr:hypothetical protein [Longimicrobiales bacterium]